MTIQEPKDRMYICTSPHSAHITDAQWQKKFLLMKQVVQPSRYRHISSKGSLPCNTYDRITNWQSYALFINDTLSQLRSGETAYAWFTYQIQDLLRFEHDRLCTCYCPAERMWTLWLTNE